jgi:hypothetical protein
MAVTLWLGDPSSTDSTQEKNLFTRHPEQGGIEGDSMLFFWVPAFAGKTGR